MAQANMSGGADLGFNPFDPIQDTESIIIPLLALPDLKFQPIRSDTGY